MGLSIIRLLMTIASIILTIVLFSYDMVLFDKYVGRGKYYYENISNDIYMVVKQGHSIRDCSINGTIFKYGEINWLVVRNKRHYLFLFCFWGAVILALATSLSGSVLEYIFKSDLNWRSKFFRILRSMAYKNSLSIPATVLFAFDYTKPCLKLKKTTFMVFSNSFTYVTIAIECPLLAIIFIDVVYELYKWKPNAGYDLLKTTIENQPTCRKTLHIVLYSILFMIIIFLLYLSLSIYLKLFLLINLPHILLVGSNVLLSIASILLAS